MKVLYATDGGAPALHALTLWIRLAAPNGARVTPSRWPDVAPPERTVAPLHRLCNPP
jgi:hypothetical protein